MNETLMTGRDRNGTADLLKGLAVLFMIQVHIMEQFASSEVYESVLGQVSMFLGGPACAPVFLAVMGYFLASGNKPFLYYLKRGIFLFAGGILLNIARSANLLIKILNGSIEVDPWSFVFGVDILPLAGISLVIIGMLRMLFKTNGLLYLASAVIIATVSPLVADPASSIQYPASSILHPASTITALNYLRAFFTGTANWSYFPVFPWISYILTGISFRHLLQNPRVAGILKADHLLVYSAPAWVILMLTIQWASGITHTLEGPDGYYHHGFLFFAWVSLFMAAYVVLVQILELNRGELPFLRLVKWTGRHVTLVYVIQWLIIGNLATNFYKSQGLFGYFGWFLGISAVSLILSWLILKIWSDYIKPHYSE